MATQQLVLAIDAPAFIRCCMCGETKPADAFAFRAIATRKRQTHCRSCHAAYRRGHYERNRADYIARAVAQVRRRFLENRERIIAYLRDHPCVDCGERDVVVLDFDHRDRRKKTGYVTWLAARRAWPRVEAEIRKCDVRCANCHVRRTATQCGWWRARVSASAS